MQDCIPDVTSYMLGIQELRLGEAAALIQGDPGSRAFIVMTLEEILAGPFSIELLSFPFFGVTHRLHDLHQFAEDIVTEALKRQAMH